MVACEQDAKESLTTNLSLDDFRAAPADDDQVSDELLEVINMALPEGQSAPDNNPLLFPSDFEPVLETVSPTDVWVTFIKEGAGYKNAFGYFTYPAGQPPLGPPDPETLKEGLIFANASALLSGGKLYNGRRMHLGTVPKGVELGFYLVANGYCTSGAGCDLEVNVNFSRATYYSLDDLNPEDSNAARRHVVMADFGLEQDARLLAWEDLNRDSLSADEDFNDLVFRLTASPWLLSHPSEPYIGDYDPSVCESNRNVIGIDGLRGVSHGVPTSYLDFQPGPDKTCASQQICQ